MTQTVITGSGLYIPPNSATNEELVASFNKYVDNYNQKHASEIEAGTVEALNYSSEAFIEKASGIKSRYFVDASGILDPERMIPNSTEGTWVDDKSKMSQMVMAIEASEKAMEEAGLTPEDIDLIVFSSTIVQQHVPSMAITLQSILGTKGFAYDTQMACSSATFGLAQAESFIKSGMAKRALIVTAEYLSPLMNYKDRDSHFIFGDVGVATIIEREDVMKGNKGFRMLSSRLHTELSENITAYWSFVARLQPEKMDDPALYFKQEGRKVFKELLPMVINLISDHLAENKLGAEDLKRMWLHQANINMNMFAAKKLLGRDPSFDEAPTVLEEFGNTGGAGCVIAFDKYHDDFKAGEKGILCSFGAGYSIGSVIVEYIEK